MANPTETPRENVALTFEFEGDLSLDGVARVGLQRWVDMIVLEPFRWNLRVDPKETLKALTALGRSPGTETVEERHFAMRRLAEGVDLSFGSLLREFLDAEWASAGYADQAPTRAHGDAPSGPPCRPSHLSDLLDWAIAESVSSTPGGDRAGRPSANVAVATAEVTEEAFNGY